MTRSARVVVSRSPDHVTQRGNQRQTTFFAPSDYRNRLSLLAVACR